MNRTQWLICIIASIGFAFDTYELLMLPLIIKPALFSLGGLVAGTPEYTHWARILFFVPAIAGGIFGLLGGWLTDRLGRRRVLTWSIFDLCIRGICSGVFHQSSPTFGLPLFCFCRCVCGIRGRRRLVGRNFPGAEATGKSAWLYPGVCFCGRLDGRPRLCLVRAEHGFSALDLWCQ
jgi:nitrate/nitrite transporter NarK